MEKNDLIFFIQIHEDNIERDEELILWEKGVPRLDDYEPAVHYLEAIYSRTMLYFEREDKFLRENYGMK